MTYQLTHHMLTGTVHAFSSTSPYRVTLYTMTQIRYYARRMRRAGYRRATR